MYKLLEIRHWFLFVVIIFPPAIAGAYHPNGFWYLVIIIWSVQVYSCWLFSVGVITYKKENTPKFDAGIFKIGFIYLLCYPFFLFYDSSLEIGSFPVWQIPLHLIGMLFSFYMMFFVAKNLVQFEIIHNLKTQSVFLTFCAIWFYPIDIFFVQPRINQITKQ